ncbi:ArsR/SmtB family transcription factor [Pseudomonas shirazensis]|uniref:ArsR/SmtB family transcription factor n=1 Tax=Pseudomonas shirazensis TaxID=2745494 RepID=UPI003D2C9AB3
MKAMSSEVRLTVLRLLANPHEHFAEQWSADPVEIGVCMTLIAKALGVAQPTASRHLEILVQAGFVTVAKKHKWSYCKRSELMVSEYLEWLAQELAVEKGL